MHQHPYIRGENMPVITIDGPALSKEQKKDLVKSFTKEAARVTGIPTQAFVVLINENNPDNVGVDGELLSDRMAKNQ
jgi:4-oxalocrotonate tautomerase